VHVVVHVEVRGHGGCGVLWNIVGSDLEGQKNPHNGPAHPAFNSNYPEGRVGLVERGFVGVGRPRLVGRLGARGRRRSR